jgi:hypothetical protein
MAGTVSPLSNQERSSQASFSLLSAAEGGQRNGTAAQRAHKLRIILPEGFLQDRRRSTEVRIRVHVALLLVLKFSVDGQSCCHMGIVRDPAVLPNRECCTVVLFGFFILV